MSLAHRHCRTLASAMLALAALGAAPAASFAQGAMAQGTMGVEAQRRSVQVQRLRAEQRRNVARAQAHAQMPDTMYASTPDRSPPAARRPPRCEAPGRARAPGLTGPRTAHGVKSRPSRPAARLGVGCGGVRGGGAHHQPLRGGW